jgi:hypothetical protein
MRRRTTRLPATVRLFSFQNSPPSSHAGADHAWLALALALVATSSGGRRTGPSPQPESSGGLVKQQSQSQSQPASDLSAESLDSRKEAAEALAARYRASRERLHQAGGSGGGVDVVGA